MLHVLLRTLQPKGVARSLLGVVLNIKSSPSPLGSKKTGVRGY